MEELEKSASSETDGGLLGLPETETELENLTEFNTAHNRPLCYRTFFFVTDSFV
jgi:nuclear inhibitor of protein phosphatase 1